MLNLAIECWFFIFVFKPLRFFINLIQSLINCLKKWFHCKVAYFWLWFIGFFAFRHIHLNFWRIVFKNSSNFEVVVLMKWIYWWLVGRLFFIWFVEISINEFIFCHPFVVSKSTLLEALFFGRVLLIRHHMTLINY